MMKKNSITKLVVMMLAAAVMACALSGCSKPYDASDYQPPTRRYEDADDTGPVESSQKDIDTDPVPETAQLDISSGEPESTEPSVRPQAPMESVDAIAVLGSLVGNYEIYSMHYCATVDIDNSHNPYDLTWAYGEKPSSDPNFTINDEIAMVTAPEWGALYESYVDACDWSLVFDADYYMSEFPMLACLYHYDEHLLLEHFQTVGVHEGRQANRDFNVDAYMQNCSQELRAAFGDNCECYYFYWMLNQETEKTVDTDGTGHPSWLTVETSYYQSIELEKVNGFRKGVGASPVVLDPEMIAFANYRAWHDAKYAIKAHDAINDPDIDAAMDALDIDHFAENTCKWHHPSSNGKDILKQPYSSYYCSKPHYDAMVAEKYVYAGFSNSYLSEYTERTVAQFDMYTEYTPVTSR